MTKEALKLALEVLENGDVPTPENVGKNLDAITAIKEALAQPPQRPWVGLTAEEAAECWTTSATQTWKNFEAKLKELNNG